MQFISETSSEGGKKINDVMKTCEGCILATNKNRKWKSLYGKVVRDCMASVKPVKEILVYFFISLAFVNLNATNL